MPTAHQTDPTIPLRNNTCHLILPFDRRTVAVLGAVLVYCTQAFIFAGHVNSYSLLQVPMFTSLTPITITITISHPTILSTNNPTRLSILMF